MTSLFATASTLEIGFDIRNIKVYLLMMLSRFTQVVGTLNTIMLR